MANFNTQYVTHPLYNHFKAWIDMEDAYYDLYFAINTSLYAAEEYIYKTYGVYVQTHTIQEYLGDIDEPIVQLQHSPTNILGVYTDAGYTLPSVTYIDNNIPASTSGPFTINDNSLKDVKATNLLVNYNSGFTYPPTSEFTDTTSEDTSEVGEGVSTPIICNPDGSPLSSPISVSGDYFNLHIIGDPTTTIYINGTIGELKDAQGNTISTDILPNIIINDDRIGKATLDLVVGLNTFDITTIDGSNNESKKVTLVINRQLNILPATSVIVNKDLVSIDGNINITIKTVPGSSIEANATTLVAYTKGVDSFVLPLPNTNGVQNIDLSITSPYSSGVEILNVQALVDSTMTSKQIAAVNSVGQQETEMPQDLLMALLMVANHYFKIALYKNDENQSYGDNVSNRTTFINDRFPKDAHMILSKYVTY